MPTSDQDSERLSGENVGPKFSESSSNVNAENSLFPVAHALIEAWLRRYTSINARCGEKRCNNPFMSLLPQYREREEQVPTGEAGMKKSNLIFPIQSPLNSIRQRLKPDEPTWLTRPSLLGKAAAECVSEEALVHLKSYKYSSVDKSLISHYILRHYVRGAHTQYA